MEKENRCPICGQDHILSKKSKMEKTIIKDQEVEYSYEYYKCDKCEDEDSEYCDGEMLNENLLRARDAYRIKKGLLTSKEIIEIRKLYGLTQVELARLMGIGDVTITRYETKSIQEPIYDDELRKIKSCPMHAIKLLEKNSDKFDDNRKSEIRKALIEKHEMFGKENETRIALESQYISYNVKSSKNGFKLLDIDTIEGVISYFALRRKALHKTMLMKFLWYADVMHYKKYGESITGLVYIHEKYGALPIGHYELIGLNNVLKEENQNDNNYSITIKPNTTLNTSCLSHEIVEILDMVIDKFASMQTNDVVDYMHNENIYQNTKFGDILEFA